MRAVGKRPKRTDCRGVLAVSAIVLKQTGKQAGGLHVLSQGQLVRAHRGSFISHNTPAFFLGLV